MKLFREDLQGFLLHAHQQLFPNQDFDKCDGKNAVARYLIHVNDVVAGHQHHYLQAILPEEHAVYLGSIPDDLYKGCSFAYLGDTHAGCTYADFAGAADEFLLELRRWHNERSVIRFPFCEASRYADVLNIGDSATAMLIQRAVFDVLTRPVHEPTVKTVLVAACHTLRLVHYKPRAWSNWLREIAYPVYARLNILAKTDTAMNATKHEFIKVLTTFGSWQLLLANTKFYNWFTETCSVIRECPERFMEQPNLYAPHAGLPPSHTFADLRLLTTPEHGVEYANFMRELRYFSLNGGEVHNDPRPNSRAYNEFFHSLLKQ